MPLPIIAGIVVRAAIRYAARAAVQYGGRTLSRRALRQLMDRAKRYGDDLLDREIARRRACANCRRLDDLVDPCAFLRQGVPGSQYRGGSYSGVRQGGREAHHVPAQGAYGRGSMSPNRMPAISMDPGDHRQTASHGSSADAQAYRNAQRAALRSRGGIAAAFAMDVADIKLKFGDKYDDAIMQAGAYVACITRYPDKYPVR